MNETLPRVLLVEDIRSLSALYAAMLSRNGEQVEAVYSAGGAIAAHRPGQHRVILLDLLLPDGDGIGVLRAIQRRDPEARVLVITADGSISRAVEAMREGAFDFLVKPFDERRLIAALTAAMPAGAPSRAVAPASSATRASFEGFLGSSEAMRAVYRVITRVGGSTAAVFITGETGTGKEICARAIHDVSPRRGGPFIAVSCGAIPATLLESELFGHVRGAFTGAVADNPGAATAADGGTLFLDEICEMDIALQSKLLRFLQTGEVQPVGAAHPRPVDVRIVCATNRDPEAEVCAGRFRADLYYRLHVVPVALPPLRSRGEDVIEIAEAALARYAAEEGRSLRRLSPEVRALFRRYDWPGNVRQLQNLLRRIVVLHDGDEVTPGMLPPGLRDRGPGEASAPGPFLPGAAASPMSPGFAEPEDGLAAIPAAPASRADAVAALVGGPLAEIERAVIEATIARCGGSLPRAARMLGISASTVYRKRAAWDGPPPE
jgi:DNA-binding NtrC family response regulator